MRGGGGGGEKKGTLSTIILFRKFHFCSSYISLEKSLETKRVISRVNRRFTPFCTSKWILKSVPISAFTLDRPISILYEEREGGEGKERRTFDVYRSVFSICLSLKFYFISQRHFVNGWM